MNLLRLATEEEVKNIQAKSDLEPGCVVLAEDFKSGTALAVLRMPVEVDPAFINGLDTRAKVVFFRDIENFLLGRGVTHYYFNVPATEETAEWRENVESWGAEPTEAVPSVRYKRVLIKDS